MARHEEGAWPPAPGDRRATKPAGLFRENPSGGGSFAGGLRWLGRYSPLCGCSGLAALAAAKISRRRTRPISKQALKALGPGKVQHFTRGEEFWGWQIKRPPPGPPLNPPEDGGIPLTAWMRSVTSLVCSLRTPRFASTHNWDERIILDRMTFAIIPVIDLLWRRFMENRETQCLGWGASAVGFFATFCLGRRLTMRI